MIFFFDPPPLFFDTERCLGSRFFGTLILNLHHHHRQQQQQQQRQNSISARCRHPPPPGSTLPRISFGGKKLRVFKGPGGARAAAAGEEGRDAAAADDGDATGRPSTAAAPFSVEERGPLAPFASSGFDGGARRVLPRNLLRRAAVLSALELAPGGGGGGVGGGEEEEEEDDDEDEEEDDEDEEEKGRGGAGGEKPEGPKRASARDGGLLRRVLVRTRVVAHSGEEATLLWRAEREEHESNQGCWLVASVARDGDGDFDVLFGGGPEAALPPPPLSPHPRLGPEQVVCAAAMDLVGGGRAAERWMSRAGAEGGAGAERAAAATAALLGLPPPPPPRHAPRSPPSPSPSAVTVVSSATPGPGVALVETATAAAPPGGGRGEGPTRGGRRRREEEAAAGEGGPIPRPARLLWTLFLDEGGCWGISEVMRLG